MGLPKSELWVTNTGDPSGEILLSAYKPVKKENGKYYAPPKTPLGYDMWIPNCLGLKPEEGVVRVEIVKTKEETGIWLMCFDDYFGSENHIFVNKKPEWILDKEGKKTSVKADHFNSLHVSVPFKTKHGDGPINIGFRLMGNKKKDKG